MYLKLVRPTCEYAEQVMEYKEDIPTCLLLFLGCMILTISCIIVTLTNEKKYRDKKDDKE